MNLDELHDGSQLGVVAVLIPKVLWGLDVRTLDISHCTIDVGYCFPAVKKRPKGLSPAVPGLDIKKHFLARRLCNSRLCCGVMATKRR